MKRSVLGGCVALLLGMAVTTAVGIGASYGMEQTPQQPQVHLRKTLSALAADAEAATPEPAATGTSAIGIAAVGPYPGDGFVRLPGHVLDALTKAIPDAAARSNSHMSLTVVLRRDDQAGFDRYVHDLYDSSSANFRHFLTQTQIADRFGPSRRDYAQVSAYLQGHGFKIVQRSKNRMTLAVRGTRAQAEKTFSAGVTDFKMGETHFFANQNDPALPIPIAGRVQAVIGLNSLARPQSVIQPTLTNLKNCSLNTKYTQDLQIECAVTYGLDLALYDILCMLSNLFLGKTMPFLNSAAGVVGTTLGGIPTGNGQFFTLCSFQLPYQNPISLYPSGTSAAQAKHSTGLHSAERTSGAQPEGQGQKIGLVEFDSFNTSDVSDLLAYLGMPASTISQLNVVKLPGSPPIGAGEDEVLLDIGVTLTNAPNASTTVYEAPFTGVGSFQSVFNRMINDGMTVISNSWAYCEDQTTLADVQSIDSILQSAAAAGISVFSGSGDTGDTCLDGSKGVIAVPADSPNITAVGGTTANLGLNYYGSETWWDGSTSVPSTGQGGFGTSKFFARPSYQDGFNNSTQRSIPDVVSAADPSVNGLPLCKADQGGCPNGLSYGGTSASTPFWASLTALFNAVGGANIGLVNALYYSRAATAGFQGFHTPASMGSDFSHVGLGSPNGSFLFMSLTGVAVGPAVAATSGFAGKPGELPADGTSTANLIVELADANSASVSGKTVTLTASAGSHAVISSATSVTSTATGTANFTVTDATAETVTFMATDTTDGFALAPVTIVFDVPPPASAGISANPGTVTADGQSAATVTVTLKDSLNRAVPGKTVTVSDNGSHAVLTGPTPGVTDANGQISFSATDQVNETVTFTAVDITDGNLALPGSASVIYSSATSTACGVNVVPVASAGYTITPFVTGLPAAPTFYYAGANIGCPGANNPAFTATAKVLVSDFLTGGIYQTGLSGGAVSSSNQISVLNPALGPLVYGKDGSLYATSGNGGAQILQVDPNTGASLRVVASGLTCPAGLSVDPLSGDLFFDDQCTGAGFDNPSVFRVIDPANTDPANPTSVVIYATLPTTPNGGMAFAPNGTLYAVSGYFNNATPAVEQISPTNSATVTVTAVAGISSDYGIAIGATNADGSAQSLIVESAGALSELPIANPTQATVLASVSPGIGVTGPDGCLYSEHYDTIYKLANSSGPCSFAPTSPAPSIKLSPAAVSPNPSQGGTQTLTATLHNVSPLAGVPVVFQIGGINTQRKLVDTDANGNAVLTYTGVQAGTDTVIATATSGSTALTSNTAQVTWGAGKHITFASLNTSPGGGAVNQAVTVTAQLSDGSVQPSVVIAGQTLTFTLDGSSCSATTDATGVASCQVTPSQVGTSMLTAAFAGTSTFAATTGSAKFVVLAAAAPAPTATISANPSSVAAGSPTTLTWSSTNATACTASGSWSGTLATSGTQSVTPSAIGSYTYTLVCTGAGGNASASAVVSANLVAVTVTAKSGGGAMSGYLLLSLGLLVMLRFRALRTGRLAFSTRRGGGHRTLGISMVVIMFAFATVHVARADQSAATQSAATDQPTAVGDPFYVGVRVGSMPLRLESNKIDQGLAALGFGTVTADSDTSGIGGTVFLGYAFTEHAALELGYTYRNSDTAHLSGTIPSSASLTPLLQDTTELIRGYGNIVSLSYSGRFELLPRFSLEPRLGGFFWATKTVATGLDDRVDATHEGGGVTAGVTAAYRVWRGLELGINVDHYRGFPNNIATLYGGSVEWRFGR
jgi:hypothetical protein